MGGSEPAASVAGAGCHGPPLTFDADSVREQEVQVFRSIRPMSVEDVARFTARGQYGSSVIDGNRVSARASPEE